MSAKAIAQCNEIRTDLARRFTTVGPTQFDVNGQPYFVIGAATAGSQSAIVKVQDFSIPGATNAINLAQAVYGNPAIAQVLLETSTLAGVPLLTAVNQLALLNTVAFRGLRVELYMTANTVPVTIGAIVAGNLVATWDPDQKYKMLQSM
jgi:hypothetical protein